MAKQFFLIAVEATDHREGDFQGALEELADLSASEVTVIDEADVPATAYRIEWVD